MTEDSLKRLDAQLYQHEGERLRMYSDTKGKVTIGRGHNLTDNGISPAASLFIYREDRDEAIADIAKALPWVLELCELRQRVFVDIRFNSGLHGLLGFHDMIGYAKKQDWQHAALEIIDSQLAEDRKLRLAKMMETGTYDPWANEAMESV